MQTLAEALDSVDKSIDDLTESLVKQNVNLPTIAIHGLVTKPFLKLLIHWHASQVPMEQANDALVAMFTSCWMEYLKRTHPPGVIDFAADSTQIMLNDLGVAFNELLAEAFKPPTKVLPFKGKSH